jgi:hypothetical protein
MWLRVILVEVCSKKVFLPTVGTIFNFRKKYAGVFRTKMAAPNDELAVVAASDCCSLDKLKYYNNHSFFYYNGFANKTFISTYMGILQAYLIYQ